jgi:hypothetical protein
VADRGSDLVGGVELVCAAVVSKAQSPRHLASGSSKLTSAINFIEVSSYAKSMTGP